MRKIVIGLDGSRDAESAIGWAEHVYPRASLVLAQVVPCLATVGPMGQPMPFVDLRADAREYLQDLAFAHTPRLRTVALLGSPAEGLIRIASETRADIITIAAHGGSPVRRRMIGRTAEKLLHNAKTLLLVCPAGSPQPKKAARIRRLLVPLDGSSISEEVIPLAAELAKAHDAEVILFHCLNELQQGEGLLAELRWRTRDQANACRLAEALAMRAAGSGRYFGALASRTRDTTGVPTRAVLRGGAMPGSLFRAVRDREADLIVMCAHGHGALQHLMHGGLPSRIIQGCTVPVLVGRHDVLRRGRGS